MAYKYEVERKALFSEEGVKMLLKVRDNVDRLLKYSGAFECGYAMSNVGGDSWQHLAALDYLCEIGVLKKVYDQGRGQDQVFVRGGTMSGAE